MGRKKSPERQKVLAERAIRREERLKRKAAKEENKQAKIIKKSRKEVINNVHAEEKAFSHRKKEASERISKNGGVKVKQPTLELSSFASIHAPVTLYCMKCHTAKKSVEFVEPELCEMCSIKNEFTK